MKHKYICVFTLAVFGAASAYSQITLNPVPERAVGTPQLLVENSSQSPNLVEGREFYAPPQGKSTCSGLFGRRGAACSP